MTTQSMFSVGGAVLANGGACSSAAWPTTNRAYFFPFVLTTTRTYVLAIWANGATVSGNVDLGIYDTDGTRKTSTGSQAQSGTSVNQKFTLASALTLAPGRYFMAMSVDNTTATVIRATCSAPSGRVCGSQMMDSAFVLPATATFARYAGSHIPLFGFSEVSWL